MLEHVILLFSLLASGHVGLGTVFGHSSWDKTNPHSRLACEHRDIRDTDLVVAHNTLPCHTQVWLFNPRTGRSVIARVADRGPMHAYVDMSRAVAKRLHHNGKEQVLLVPLPSAAKLATRAAAELERHYAEMDEAAITKPLVKREPDATDEPIVAVDDGGDDRPALDDDERAPIQEAAR